MTELVLLTIVRTSLGRILVKVAKETNKVAIVIVASSSHVAT